MKQLVFVVVAALAACSPQQQTQTQRQVNQAVSSIPSPVKRGAEDAALTAKVAAAMAAQAGINAFNVKPTVSGGVVTLTGKAPTPEIKSTILSAVRRVHGVTLVVDHIAIGR